MNALSSLLDRQVGLFGPKLATQFRPRYRSIRWSYEELSIRVSRLAAVLASQDVGPGDRVLLFAESSPYWVAAFFAILVRGAVVVPLNPKSTPAQINRIIASAEPKAVLLSARFPWQAAPLPSIRMESAVAAEGVPGVEESILPAGDGLAEIIYTSGTTGDPKGVMLTHDNLLSDLEAVIKAVPLDPDDHVLSLLPLFHVFGQMSSVLCPLRGGCAVTYLGAPTSRAIMEGLAYVPATHFVTVPEVLKTMMDRLESRLGRLPGWARRAARDRIRSRISRTLRTIVCGGAPLDPAIEEKWWALGFEVLQGYGLTETSPVISANSPSAHRIGSVGKPLEGVDVRITAEGEIVVRGPTVMRGYYRDPERTKAAFVDGWFKTDDAGAQDPDGFLFVFGRMKYMILGPSGENVFPEDLEAELNRIPGVTDSAVIGLERNGRTVIHAVLLCSPEHADDFVAQANQHLAPHQQIMSWSVWMEADFPRSATRKVKKEEVIRRLADHRTTEPVIALRVTPVKRLLAELTGVRLDAVSGDARLVADLGLDSLLRIELVSRIEDQLNVSIEEVQITPTTMVAELEQLVEERKRTAPELVKYPRWSLAPWATTLRPLALSMFFRSWIMPFCRLRIEGVEHVTDLQGPVILMANHRSYLDSAVATFAIPRHLRARLGIAAATEVLYRQYRWAVPLGELALNAFPFPTGVDENIRPGLDYIGRMLDDGWNVLIFPEGRMNRTDQPLQSLKGGTGVIAVEMGVPIVPVAIEGTEKVMPPGEILPRTRVDVTVRFGPPVRVGTEDHYDVGTARVEAALRALLRS